jgi:hypothetical protein
MAAFDTDLEVCPWREALVQSLKELQIEHAMG